MLNFKSLKFTLKVAIIRPTKSLNVFTIKVAIIRPKCSKPEKNYPVKKIKFYGDPVPPPSVPHTGPLYETLNGAWRYIHVIRVEYTTRILAIC
jgi:hypothetical protein